MGGVQKQGYMPDSFGHLAQMPQILQKCGIGSFLYTRGNGDEIDRTGQEFLWKAPDGSEVLALNQCEGYCNAGGLGHEEIWHAHTPRNVSIQRAVDKIRELFEKTRRRSASENFLISNGCDHFPAQKGFEEILRALEEAFPETEFSHGPLSDYVSAVSMEELPLKVHEGELLGARLHFVLSGVWSSRVNLKQENDEIQELLCGQVEPLASYAYFCQEQNWPGEELAYAWKKLLENHPHDSICGCSTDAVHREMLSRFAAARESAQGLIQRAHRKLCPEFAPEPEGDQDTLISVFNPLPEKRSEVVERMILLQPGTLDFNKLRLFDEEGNLLPQDRVFLQEVERFWGVDYRNLPDCKEQLQCFEGYRQHFGERLLNPEAESADRYLHLVFEAKDLPALGHRNYLLRESDEDLPLLPGDPVLRGERSLENGQLSMRICDEGLELLHRKTGRRYSQLCRFLDEGDRGDEYDFAALPEGAFETDFSNWEIHHPPSTPLRGVLELRGSFLLPVSLTKDRNSRSGKMVECPVRLRISLDAGSDRLDLEVRIDNRAKDHRLRMDFPLPFESQELWSEDAFRVALRPVHREWKDDWAQKELRTWPQQGFSLMQDDQGGLAVFSKGLKEVEAREDGFSFTLLRAVGWLSRDDFPERGNANAGPTIPTPDAQMQGEQCFSLSLVPFRGDWRDADVFGKSLRWRRTPRVRQGVLEGSAPSRSLIAKQNPGVAFSALRVHEERGTMILRLFNLGEEPQVETLDCKLPIRGVWICNLLEEREQEREVQKTGSFTVELAGHEILCLEIQCTCLDASAELLSRYPKQ
jgi:mannosylglycerate hydrolase